MKDTTRNILWICIVGIFISFLNGQLFSYQVYWGESPLLTARAWQLGSGHPPGYPAFMLLVHFFQIAPLTDIAEKSNLVGSMALVLTCVLLNLIWKPENLFEKLAALGICLLFCFSPVMLNANAACEVYTLNLALIAGLCFLIRTAQFSIRSWSLFFFLTGLTLTHHLTAIFFIIPAGLETLFFVKKVRNRARYFLTAVLFFIIGCSVWLYLPIRESAAPSAVWGNPDRWVGFVTLVTASEEARGSLLEGVKSPALFFNRIRVIIRSSLDVFGYQMSPFVVLGGIYLWKKSYRFPRLLMAFLLFLVLSVGLYATNESQSFFLPGTMVLVIFLGFGVIHLTKIIPPGLIRPHLLAAIVALVLLFTLGKSIHRADEFRTNDVSAPRWLARNWISRLKESDIVVSRQSDISFLMWYFRIIERSCENQVIFQHLLSFVWYYQDLQQSGRMDFMPKLDVLDFEDTWEWNRYVLGKITVLNYRDRKIWLTDPESLNDLNRAGVRLFQVYPDYIYFFILSQDIHPKVTLSITIPLADGLDPVSSMILSRWFFIAGKMYQTRGMPGEAEQLTRIAEQLYHRNLSEHR